MKNDRLYQKFIAKWQEVTELPPQTIGPLTPVYKRTVPYFKTQPWRILMPLAFAITVCTALLLEVTAVQVASFLQKGF